MVEHQYLSTAGMWWNVEGFNFYVDPGPGAMWHLNNSLADLNLKLEDLDTFFISHKHLDHTTDLNCLVDASFWLKIKKEQGSWQKVNADQVLKAKEAALPKERKSVLFIPKDCLEESDKVLHDFLVSSLQEIIVLEPEKRYKIKNIEFSFTKNLLEKPRYGKMDEFGFWIKGEKIDLGYLPETYYKQGLFNGFRPKILIYNCLSSEKEHLLQMTQTLKELKPKIAILRHFVRRTFVYGPEKLAQKLTKEAGVNCLAAQDFSVFDIEKESFIKQGKSFEKIKSERGL